MPGNCTCGGQEQLASERNYIALQQELERFDQVAELKETFVKIEAQQVAILAEKLAIKKELAELRAKVENGQCCKGNGMQARKDSARDDSSTASEDDAPESSGSDTEDEEHVSDGNDSDSKHEEESVQRIKGILTPLDYAAKTISLLQERLAGSGEPLTEEEIHSTHSQASYLRRINASPQQCRNFQNHFLNSVLMDRR